MYLPALWTNEDGSVNEEMKAEVLAISLIYHQQLKRMRHRCYLMTKWLDPPYYYHTSLGKDKTNRAENMCPTLLHEPQSKFKGQELPHDEYNNVDYMINFAKKVLNKTFTYSEHKELTTELVKYFNLKPSVITNKIPCYEDLSGNKYMYDLIWYHMYKYMMNKPKAKPI